TSSKSIPIGARDASRRPRARAVAAVPPPIRAACRATPRAGNVGESTRGDVALAAYDAVEDMAESNPGDVVLVTGASGLVGSAIANAAREAGYRVRVLVRASSPRTNIAPSDEAVLGDICDRASLAAALRGARYLVHAAADYRLWSPAPQDIIRTNVEGTRAVMEEALRAGVERIVHTSSVATLALRDDEPADETRRLSASETVGVYKKSKVIAERLVEAMVEQQRLPAVIVNPSTPIGPRDVKPTPTGRIIVEAACGRMPGFVETGLNLAHVDDVAA